MGDVLNSGVIPQADAGGGGQADVGSGDSAAAAVISTASLKGAAGAAAVWADDAPIAEQLGTYPATCFLVAAFVTVFAVMWHKRMSPLTMGSSYRQIVMRLELWRVLTAAFVHGGFLHLAFNISGLWRCRRIEAELGSPVYLLASLYLLILAESCEQTFQHVMYRAAGLMGDVSCGYSGVLFAWMVVLAMKPDAASQTIAGVEVGGFMYVMLNLFVGKFLIPRISFVGHLAGVFAGLVFSTGGLDFLRTRYWGAGMAAWMLALFLGSLKATAGVAIPFVDYVDMSGHSDLGIRVIQFDWSSRDVWEEHALSNV